MQFALSIRHNLICLPHPQGIPGLLWIPMEGVHLLAIWRAITCLNLEALTAKPLPKSLQQQGVYYFLRQCGPELKSQLYASEAH